MIRTRNVECRLKKLKEWLEKGLISDLDWSFKTSDLISAWNKQIIDKIGKESSKK